MPLRSNSLVRVLLLLCVFALGWYTVRLYAGLYGKIMVKPENQDEEAVKVATRPDKEEGKKEETKKESEINDPDHLVDHEKIEQAEKEWDKNITNIKIPQYQCEMTTKCTDGKFSFKIVSGAANVIGPSICFNGNWIMRNVLNNVDRGMNIAVVNGIDGSSVKSAVFDLYSKDSTELKKFLKERSPDEILLITSYDDAAFQLDDEARGLLTELGSKKSKELAFRDNWIFVGGKKITSKEEHIKHDKATNKYGDWPEALNLEGCLEKNN